MKNSKKIKTIVLMLCITIIGAIPVFASMTDLVGTSVSTTTSTTISISEETRKKGDVNGDGYIKLNDAQMALKAALNILDLTDEEFEAADIFGNEFTKLEDAQAILRAALNIISDDELATLKDAIAD